MSELITADQLTAIFPRSPKATRAQDAADLCHALEWCDATTPERIAGFLGQIGHECDELRYAREVWGPSTQQLRYERNFDEPWRKVGVNSLAYRLNNNQPGDGYRYRGWGWIQVTGRGNTLIASLALYGDDRLIVRHELLDDRSLAALGAAWYWKHKTLNDLIDRHSDYHLVTQAVNGASTDGAPSHHMKRHAYYDRSLRVLTGAV